GNAAQAGRGTAGSARHSRRHAETTAAARSRRPMPRPISRRSRCVPFPLLTPLFGRFAPTRPPLAGEGWGGGNLWHEASHRSSSRRKPASTFPLARAIQYGIIILALWATSAPRGAVGPGFRREEG